MERGGAGSPPSVRDEVEGSGGSGAAITRIGSAERPDPHCRSDVGGVVASSGRGGQGPPCGAGVENPPAEQDYYGSEQR